MEKIQYSLKNKTSETGYVHIDCYTLDQVGLSAVGEDWGNITPAGGEVNALCWENGRAERAC